MTIAVSFETFEEMVDFAGKLAGQALESNEAAVTPKQEAPTQVSTSAVPTATAAPVSATLPVAPAAPAATVSPTPAAPVSPSTVPTSSHTYTPDELAKAAMQLMDSGRQMELLNLLSQFGVDSIPSLQPTQYGGFATALRGLGAQI